MKPQQSVWYESPCFTQYKLRICDGDLEEVKVQIAAVRYKLSSQGRFGESFHISLELLNKSILLANDNILEWHINSNYSYGLCQIYIYQVLCSSLLRGKQDYSLH